MATRTERCLHGPTRGLAYRPSGPRHIIIGRREASESPAPAAAVNPAFGHLRYLAQFTHLRVRMSSPKLNPRLYELRVGGVLDHRLLTCSRACPLSTSEWRLGLDEDPLMSASCPVVGGGLSRRNLTVREVSELLFPSSLSSSRLRLSRAKSPFVVRKSMREGADTALTKRE